MLPLNPPPGPDAVRHAAQQLRDPEVRLIHELFWFWPASGTSSQTDEVLTMLRLGKIREASQAWLQAENNGHDRLVASHNLAVIYHIYALDGAVSSQSRPPSDEQAKVLLNQWGWALTRWAALLKNEAFWARVAQRITSLDDPRLTSAMAAELRQQFPLAICDTCVDAVVAAADARQYDHAASLANLLGTVGFDEQIRTAAARKATSPILLRIQTLCEETAERASNDPERADVVVAQLIEMASPWLATLRAVSPDDIETEGAHDRVALCGMDSLIRFANKTERWPRVVELAEQLLEIALGDSAIEKISENLATARGNAKQATSQGPVDLVLELIDEVMSRPDLNLPTRFALLKEKAWGRVADLQEVLDWRSEEFCAIADRLAFAFRTVSVDLLNDRRSWPLASEALNLACMLVRSRELSERFAKDRATLDSLRPRSSCFIATAAFGSSTAPEVAVLRDYRDAVLSHSAFGRSLVDLYYRVSPPLARLVASSPRLASIVRTMLRPVVKRCATRLAICGPTVTALEESPPGRQTCL